MVDNTPEHVTSRSLKRGLNRIESHLGRDHTPPASQIVVAVVMTAFVIGWAAGFFTAPPTEPVKVIYVPHFLPAPCPTIPPRQLEKSI